MAIATLLALPVPSALTQTTVEFDVVSIKRAEPTPEGADTRILPGGKYVGRNVDIARDGNLLSS
jgi:hypothetical protein